MGSGKERRQQAVQFFTISLAEPADQHLVHPLDARQQLAENGSPPVGQVQDVASAVGLVALTFDVPAAFEAAAHIGDGRPVELQNETPVAPACFPCGFPERSRSERFRLAAQLCPFGFVRDSGIPAVDGVEFRSRHGDDLRMWAVFERPDQGEVSPQLGQRVGVDLSPESPDLIRALELHGIEWTA